MMFVQTLYHVCEVQIQNLNFLEINCSRIIIAQINISFIRNKFEDVVNVVRSNVDIPMISEIKIDDSFPTTQFLIEGLQYNIG